MAPAGRQQVIHDILKNFGAPQFLRKLTAALNYDHADERFPTRNWSLSAREPLAADPQLFAAAAAGHFHVIYTPLKGDTPRRAAERQIVNALLGEHPYALFVFSNEGRDRWHFVNVRHEGEHARRRLFRRIAVGADERLRTAGERIAMLDVGTFDENRFGLSPLEVQQRHDEAFNVELVTRQFFDEYKSVYDILRDDLTRQTNARRWAHDYALQFLNRCMFLCFIQRKRWLGGDTQFLDTFWRTYRQSARPENTFFEGWLRVLFFEALNNRKELLHTAERAYIPEGVREQLRRAPYLNGGPFGENELDRAPHDFRISDSRFRQVFDFLERYNFTTAEGSPLDQEVAVDPEMIGKVYESLVNVSAEADERGDAGIFYTPRTEIDLMCRLALADHLTNVLGEQHRNLLCEVVFALEPREQELADAAVRAQGLWGRLEAALREVTGVDPACGSGSFLVGLLHVLEDLQGRAASQTGNRETAYERKRRIIGQSLYGVDVMPWAAHIAGLRMWLALITDAELTREELSAHGGPLLPRFGFKIRSGDSLAQEFGEIFGDAPHKFSLVIGNPPYVRHEAIADPRAPREAVTAESKRAYKAKLRRAVYRAFPRFFGYDDEKDRARRPLDAKSDLYVYFYFLTLPLLDARGAFCFITSNSWLDVGYGADLQEFLLRRCHVRMVIDNAARRSFESAEINTVITLLSPPVPDERAEAESLMLGRTARFVMFKTAFENLLSPAVFEEIEEADERVQTDEYRVFPVKQEALLADGMEVLKAVEDEVPARPAREGAGAPKVKAGRYVGNKWGGKYLRAPEVYWTVLEKGEGRLRRLGSFAGVQRGFSTGVNDFFYFSSARPAGGGLMRVTSEGGWEGLIEQEFIRRVVRSPRDCYTIMIPRDAGAWVFWCHEDEATLNGTHALKYIRHGEERGYNLVSSVAARPRWYGLPRQQNASLFFPRAFFERFMTYLPPADVFASDRFFNISAAGGHEATALFMNTLLPYLIVELQGLQVNHGGIDTKVVLVEDLPVHKNLRADAQLRRLFHQISNRPIELVSDEIERPDRQDFDLAVLSQIGLTQKEVRAIHQFVADSAHRRILKARKKPTKKTGGGPVA